MPSINVDFDVFKALTALRSDESVSESDVIRRLLNAGEQAHVRPALKGPGGKVWRSKGVAFPVGTELRARYKGELHTAKVEAAGVRVGGELRSNLSLAANAVTGTTVNGWTFWEVRFPGETNWTIALALRPPSAA